MRRSTAFTLGLSGIAFSLILMYGDGSMMLGYFVGKGVVLATWLLGDALDRAADHSR